jgi:uncharacterized protein (TIGR03435 family)
MSDRNRKRIFTLIIGAACLSGTVFGQAAETSAKFEIADVHPSANSTNPDTWDMSGGLMRGGLYYLKRATMLDLIRTAYGLDPKKIIGGPSWLEVNRFDIRAKVPAGTTAATVKPMLQALLAERFSLVVHEDKKPVPAWALTASKHPQLKQSDGSGDSGCHVEAQSGPARGTEEPSQQAVPLLNIACHNITMADFAAHLNDMDGAWNYLNDNLVADQTGLEGAWDFNFKYSRRSGRITAAGVEITTLFDAVEKIGLKLDPASVPMSVIVVDSVNQTPTPNSPEASAAFPPPPTEFEVAEVKMADPDYHGEDFQLQPGGRLTVRGLTLKSLVEEVWGLTDDMLVGAPKFMDSDRWDIVAKASGIVAEENDADYDALFQMVKTLLADRFKLVVHTEERPVPALNMTAPKPKMRKADPASRSGCKEGPPTLVKMDPRNANPVLGRLLSCTNVTMAYFAEQLQYWASGYVHSPVLDSTGLEGGWDFTLSFSTIGQFRGGAPPLPGTSVSADPNGAVSLPDAMEKQLGLKLEPVKRQLPVMIVDHIEQKPTDN